MKMASKIPLDSTMIAWVHEGKTIFYNGKHGKEDNKSKSSKRKINNS